MQPIDIKKLRKKLGLTQTEFGELVGKKMRTIQTYESGDSTPGGKTLLKLQALFAQNFAHSDNDPSSTGSVLQFNKEGVTVTIEDIIKFAESNKQDFFEQRYFKREVELRVAKSLLELTSDPEKFKDFLNS